MNIPPQKHDHISISIGGQFIVYEFI